MFRGPVKYLLQNFFRGNMMREMRLRDIWKAQVSPIKRHLSREKSIPTVRGVSSSPSVVGIGVNETNQ
jgi:hypothetical protein